MNKDNPYDAEFLDFTTFCSVSYDELRTKIEKLRLDTIQSNDPEVKAFAEKKYLEYRTMYLDLFYKDLRMQKIYEVEENEVNKDV